MTERRRQWNSVRAIAGVAVEHEYCAATPCARHRKEPAVETQTIHCVERHRLDIAQAERGRRRSVSNREGTSAAAGPPRGPAAAQPQGRATGARARLRCLDRVPRMKGDLLDANLVEDHGSHSCVEMGGGGDTYTRAQKSCQTQLFAASSLSGITRRRSPDVECDLQRHLHRHCFSQSRARTKAPLPGGRNRLLVETENSVQRSNYTNVRAGAIGLHHTIEDDDALQARAHGIGSVRWRWTAQRNRQRHAVTDSVEHTPKARPGARSRARTRRVSITGPRTWRGTVICGRGRRRSGDRLGHVRLGLELRRNRRWLDDDREGSRCQSHGLRDR